MKQSIKIIILLSAFVLSVGGAFWVTKALKNNFTKDEPVSPSDPIVNNPVVIVDSIPSNSSNLVDGDTMNTSEGETMVKTTEGEKTEQQSLPLIEKMTSAQFERLLNNNGNISANKQVAKFVNIKTVGQKDGDRPIENGDLTGVLLKIVNELWTSVQVVSVGYDEKNRINSVVIRPIYPEAQQENQSTESQTDNVVQ